MRSRCHMISGFVLAVSACLLSAQEGARHHADDLTVVSPESLKKVA